MLLYRSVLTKRKFELIQQWKAENGGFIRSFDDITKIKGISKKTIDNLQQFCELQLQRDNQTDTVLIDPKMPGNEPFFKEATIEHENYPENFDSNGNFILYDESIPPVDLSVQNTRTTRPSSTYTGGGIKNNKVIKLVLEPKLTKFSSLRSFTSVYQDASIITYTRFSSETDWTNDVKVDAWNYHKMPTNHGKNLCQLCNQVSEIVQQLPLSDIYVVDDSIKVQHFRKPILPKKLSEIVQISQQCAILVALLRNQTSNVDFKDSNVFLMCYSTVGRLYDLFVGHEAISTQTIIKNILHDPAETIESMKLDVNNDIKHTYFKSYPVERECLGKSMLIGLSFIRLGLLKANRKSLSDT